ncbi:MAG: hypothetical protein HC889_13770 [Synechococcaceae cyanobacterium SM1_2_3]|nr:hypothetical protein [Synechococcaceae cyanobacterium SM1_2_3]
MSSPPEHERRQDHRIRHTKAEQPTFLHEGKSYAVIDYSAQSLRYAAPGKRYPRPIPASAAFSDFDMAPRSKLKQLCCG